MEPNLLTETVTSTFRVTTNSKANPQVEIKTCSEITIREFLDFLKTAYQVQESLEGVLVANGMTEAIDWLKLKESQFIKKNETSCQTIDCDLRSPSEQGSLMTNKKSDLSTAKSSDELHNKLEEVVSEGLLDSIIPYMTPSHSTSNNCSRKSSMNKVSDKSGSAILGSKKSSNELLNTQNADDVLIVKAPTGRTLSQVEIHVCDEVKNMKKDFLCNQKLLIEKMGYFAEVTAGQKLEDMDISVHCDVSIFEWLMRWVQKESQLEEDWPQLDAQCVVPILVSAAFLQMDPLLEECLRYCHQNMNDVLKTSANLSCINESILNRLAAMYTNAELDAIKDRKDKLQSKLFTKLIQSLVEPEAECVRGHWSSLARVYKCERCHQIVNPAVAFNIPCSPSSMRLQYDGSIVNHHKRDPLWNMNEYIESLYKILKTWRKVYWRLWGNAHFLYCVTCKRFFPANQYGWCRYHPDPPQFFTLDAQRAPLPVGRYPCCGDRAYRFQLLTEMRGCKFREHTVCTKDIRDSSVLNLLLNYRCMIEEEPPQLMFPERLTRLVARDQNTSERLVCRENFWWDGLEIIPHRPKMGLLNIFAENAKPGGVYHKSSDEEIEVESSSNETSSSSSSDECTPGRSKTPVSPKPKKKVKKKVCKLWQVNLSARANQDTQRAYEEKALQQMSNALNKKNSTILNPCGNRQKLGRLMLRNTTPLGGLWVRLEAEWKEQHSAGKTRSIYNGKTRSKTFKF